MTPRSRPGVVARVLLAVVRIYQSTVFFRAPRCRFSPSCSQYAVEALTLHGAVRGSWLSVRRLLRCHPFHPGGLDPVPSAVVTTSTSDDVSADTAA